MSDRTLSAAADPPVTAPTIPAAIPVAHIGRSARAQRPCRHCGGSGREPAPLVVEFARGEQAKAAEAVGISESMLSYILSGERGPSVLTLIRMAAYLRTTVDRVLRIPAIWKRVHQTQQAED